MDYKPLATSEKDEGIPPPVQVPTPQVEDPAVRRSRRLRSLAKHLAVFTILYITIVLWGRRIQEEVESEANVWLSDSFAWDADYDQDHHRHHHHHSHHDKGHTILNGKPAEDIFL